MSEYIQTGIPGIAKDKPFSRPNPNPIVRPKLLDYIEKKLMVGKEEFSRLVGVTPATVTAWLYSSVSPKFVKIQQMARILCLTLDELSELFEVVR